MKRIWIKLGLFLLLGLASTLYLLWRSSDQQRVLRQLDALLETATVQRLTLGDAERPITQFQAIVADSLILHGSPPIPQGTYSNAEATELLRNFRNSVGGCRVRRFGTTIDFPTEDEARVKALLEVDVSFGRSHRRAEKFKAELLFQRSPEAWILTRATFRSSP